MANNLYEEAINAAEQLKEAAESKVKQHLIEAMSPQIKQLVEKSLLGEEVDELSVVPVNSVFLFLKSFKSDILSSTTYLSINSL